MCEEYELVRTLLRLSFLGGVAFSLLLVMLLLTVLFAARLWTMRDDLKDMSEVLRELLSESKEGDA